MRITSVRIQGMHNVDDKLYTFDEINYICGNNGVGKSTILQAIQLCLLGYIPGTKKTKEAIFKHSNGRSMEVEITLQNDDGNNIKLHRQWVKTSKDIVYMMDTEPSDIDVSEIVKDIELPVFNFTEFLGLTANKLKDWFIDFLPDAVVDIDWEDALNSAITENNVDVNNDTLGKAKGMVLTRIRELSADDEIDSAMLVRMINSYIKEMISLQKSEIAKFQSTIQSLTFYENLPNIDVEELNSNVAQYQQYYRDRLKYDEAVNQQAQLQTQLEDYAHLADTFINDEKYKKVSENCQHMINDIQQDSKEIDKLSEYATELKLKCTQHSSIINKGSICPFTDTTCADIEHVVNDAKVAYDELKSKYDETLISLDNLQATKKEKEFELSRNQVELQAIEHEYNKRDQLKSMLQTLPELDEACAKLTLEDISNKLEEMKDLEVKLRANEEYNRVRNTIVSSKYVADDMLTIFKCWDKLTGVNGIQSSSSAVQPFIDMKTDIDKFIHILFDETTESKFNVEGKANSFSFGIVRNAQYIPYELLSSGEKCFFTLALLYAIVDRSQSDVKLIMIDDMFDHVDADRFNKLFESVRMNNYSNIQMIFAGVTELTAGGDINVIKIG